MKPKPRQFETRIPRQSDIVIDASGRVHVSFFWADLADLPFTGTVRKDRPGALPPDGVFRDGVPKAPEALIDPRPQPGYERCQLCPKNCGVDRTQVVHPRCGDATLRISTAGLSLGDEPQISGVRGSGVVMLGGCPLKCPSCHNPEMVAGGRPVTPAEFFDLAWDLAAQGAHNLQILSPTSHFPTLLLILRALKESGYPIPVVFKSSGYEAVSWISRFQGLVDLWLPDFKFGSGSEWARRSGVRDYLEVFLPAVREMRRIAGPVVMDPDGMIRSGVLVRHVRGQLGIEETTFIEEELEGLRLEGMEVSILDNFVPFE